MKEGVMENFNWTPHFKYIVQTLEGKTESEAKEREKELRQKLENAIPCNIKQDHRGRNGFKVGGGGG